ncbi:hypothetical protein [Flagellimonas meridianipacifica]|uniref:YD repeat-containing protein n=1 Tax=Flagellimonas meridianipacifica TaxID=1080225 RepID=A0A2T0MCG6_9FLAO|nr:hypothetical protein [Allomuricauda pacifica]PRX55180.1 hypothetical protein CLV81_3587 [Allomuricauda pacifica]
MIKKYTLLFFTTLFFSGIAFSQEIQIFKVEDFDLRGKVKSCLVITDYGRELFEFDKMGRLNRTITQYNESDQDITLYKYEGDNLVEKRMESYKDDVLDAATSMVNFYSIDTVSPRKVLEKIISYDKQFLEQQEYFYDEENRLRKIVISNAEGVDETTIEYQQYKNETTQSVFHNGLLEKMERVSEKKVGNTQHKVILTKEFVDGEPNSAVEKTFDASGRLLKTETFNYDVSKKQFVSSQKVRVGYGSDGMPMKETTETQNAKSVKEFIFQFDNSTEKNWIKKITTPSNAYSTRRITYYPEEEAQDQEKGENPN